MKKATITGLLTITFSITLSITSLPGATAAVAGGRGHCVASIAPLGTTAAVPAVVCYSTFSEAIAVATSGRVRLAVDATSVDTATLEQDGAVSTPAVAASSPLLAIEYLGSGYTGATLSLYGSSGTGCSGGVTYGFSSMGSGWNDTISSAKAFSGCTGRHYENSGYSGLLIDCACASMGAMDNRTSSIIFY